MDKLFRQVSVKERLPENNGGIIAICSPEDGLQQLYFKDGEFLDPMDDLPMKATAWLEEVELPSDVDIRNEAIFATNKSFDAMSDRYWIDGANYILNTLKGEKSNV